MSSRRSVRGYTRSYTYDARFGEMLNTKLSCQGCHRDFDEISAGGDPMTRYYLSLSQLCTIGRKNALGNHFRDSYSTKMLIGHGLYGQPKNLLVICGQRERAIFD